MDTLLLNADFTPLSMLPVSVIDWQTTIRLVMLGKVKVIKEYDCWEVHSPSVTLKVPSIVACTEYQKWRKGVKYSRGGILLRDDFRCQLCGLSAAIHNLTLDHVIPKSKGGKTNWHNIITACKKCNSEKGNDDTIVPKRLPTKPTYHELLAKRKKHPILVSDREWADYLGWDESLINFVSPKHLT